MFRSLSSSICFHFPTGGSTYKGLRTQGEEQGTLFATYGSFPYYHSLPPLQGHWEPLNYFHGWDTGLPSHSIGETEGASGHYDQLQKCLLCCSDCFSCLIQCVTISPLSGCLSHCWHIPRGQVHCFAAGSRDEGAVALEYVQVWGKGRCTSVTVRWYGIVTL
jgi:hypothetical protein